VDRSGQKKFLTPWYSRNAQGLAWSPKGDEIWFTATKTGAHNQLRAVTLAGRERLVSSEVAPLVLQDIARDGRVLIADSLEWRSRIFYRGPGDARDRELSGLDWSLVRDISADGKLIAFDESGEGAGGTAYAYIRDLNAPAGVKLGPGRAPILSPDQKWVMTPSVDGQSVVIYPVGVGAARHIALKGLRVNTTYLHPNGKEILFMASEPDHGSRIYRMGIDGGTSQPISAEGVTSARAGPSPDGRYIGGLSRSTGKTLLYPLAGGEPREVAGLRPGERLAGWATGGTALFVYGVGELPAKIYRLDYQTGKREFVREIVPADRAGAGTSMTIRLTPDGKAYAYTQTQILHELYLVEGLK
jgi:Tol biopolymer transport system component